jgi:hypothetical protein
MFASIASSQRALLLGLAWVLLQPLGAQALTMSDVAPLFFDGADGFGSSAATAAAAGESIRYTASTSDAWIDVGTTSSGMPISIEQVLTTVHQNPSSPSGTDPIIADSIWRIENQSGSTLIAPLLVFTAVDPSGTYPAAVPLVGIDGQLVDLLAYSVGNTEYLLGAAELGNLGVGDSVDITVRYIVTGPLAGGTSGLLPALGASVLGSYAFVPEPTTAVLVASGLLVLTAATRRKTRSRE